MRSPRIILLVLATLAWVGFVLATWAHNLPIMGVFFFLLVGVCCLVLVVHGVKPGG
jgi:hypothetical protein